MTSLTENEREWIDGVAARLRLIQADAAAETHDKRLEFIHEEVSRNLKSIPPANQKRLLDALLSRFPIGGEVPWPGRNQTAPAPALAPPAAAARDPQSDDEIIAAFFELIPKLSDEKRAELAKKVYDARLARVDMETPLDIPDDWKQKLGLKPDQRPRLTPVAELAVSLTDVIARLDQTALKILKELSPRSKVLKRPEDFRTAVARFATSPAGSESLEPHILALSSLVGGMLTAVLTSGKEFGRTYVEQMSANAIEDVVMGEGGGGIFKNKKEKCWEKFVDLSSDYATPDLIDRRIKDCMAAVVEKTARV
ncbi:MAG TPA: hypothetical protein VLT36_06400 [Candidatus Dormibacteraeota bacterium]|nr:hypothetical protein [Candidatus Dormibacteraeota bacterium]